MVGCRSQSIAGGFRFGKNPTSTNLIGAWPLPLVLRRRQREGAIMNKTTDANLLAKINVAVKAANDAEAKVTTAQAELVSRSKTVGLLLLEAKNFIRR
jgi:hypothetical protein